MNTIYTVDQAIRRGRIRLFMGALAIWLGIIFTCLFLGSINYWIPVLGIPIATPIAFLYWQYATVTWKIWAYENVRNIHELKADALKYNLIWGDGSFMQKLELKTALQKERIKKLERRFLQPDVFHDDISIRNKTEIYKAKSTPYIISGIGLLLIYIAVKELLTKPFADTYPHYFTTLPLGLYLLYRVYKDLRNKKPELTLSNEGVLSPQWGFIPWQHITATRTVLQGKQRQILEFHFHGGQRSIVLNLLGKNRIEIERIIKVYRMRYEQNILRQQRYGRA